MPEHDDSDDAVDTWNEQRTRSRRRALGMGLGALVAAALAGRWLSRPPPRAVAAPGNTVAVPGVEGALSRAAVIHSPAYAVSFYGLERLHPFDLHKYDRVLDGLMRAGLVGPADIFRAAPADRAALETAHDAAYLESLRDAEQLARSLEAPVPSFMSPAAIQRRILDPFAAAVGGTVLAAEHARDGALAIHLGGGFHHARPAMGHGFCIYNDVAVAIAALRADGWTGRVAIVDTDAHQGDGNHAFFADDPSVFTVSLHQGDIFPTPKVPGDLDVPLRGGTGDAAFLRALDGALTQTAAVFSPDLVVHVAGSDVLSDDPLAALQMTPAGMTRRDGRVAAWAAEHGAGLLHVLAGGYGPTSAAAHLGSATALLRGEFTTG